MVGKELERTAADIGLRQRLAGLGTRFSTESAVVEWHGGLGDEAGATILNLLDGSRWRLDCDALVLATPNVAEASLQSELADSGLELHAIGDCVAPREANNAFFEGRRLGLDL